MNIDKNTRISLDLFGDKKRLDNVSRKLGFRTNVPLGVAAIRYFLDGHESGDLVVDDVDKKIARILAR